MVSADRSVFERLTDGARRAIVLAQQEARRLDHQYIGTEHLLLGLLRDRQGAAIMATVNLDLTLDMARQHVEAATGRGTQQPGAHLRFTPPAQRAIEFALVEAQRRELNQADMAHLLLGLLHEREDTAARVMAGLGVDIDRAHQRILDALL